MPFSVPLTKAQVDELMAEGHVTVTMEFTLELPPPLEPEVPEEKAEEAPPPPPAEEPPAEEPPAEEPPAEEPEKKD